MTNILLSGCNGKMGNAVAQCVDARNDCRIVAGIDTNSDTSKDFPVFTNAAEFEGKVDVIVDFSHPSVLKDLLTYAVARKIPAVIATTGLDEAQIGFLHSAAEEVPVFFSANMSIGVSLLKELAQTAARVLGNSFDIEIVEMHHNQKLDAPSGTALMLADAIAEELNEQPRYEYDRHLKREKRSNNEIGIHAVRGGTITGEHDIIFAGHDEIITLSHSARSKQIFASGAVNAALFIKGKSAGLYAMKDLVLDK
ncbi:MAG TPA: 4-hydroxy-tetrahydrodipicolinate reductase [Clostridia bacterium]|nr:4-hydroxy-tetrahydrodipicolinate reductase [Clostridia bacterium]